MGACAAAAQIGHIEVEQVGGEGIGMTSIRRK